MVVVAALAFGITNGANDAANSIATVIGTRNLSPRTALLMAGVCEFAGAVTGTAVANPVANPPTMHRSALNAAGSRRGAEEDGAGADDAGSVMAVMSAADQ